VRDGSERFSLPGDGPGDVICCKLHIDRDVYILNFFTLHIHVLSGRLQGSIGINVTLCRYLVKHWDKCNVVPLLS
jgi:hypothetical protein